MPTVTATPATDAYRAAVRRAYEISKAIASEPDLDRRFELRDEQRACHDICVTSPLPDREKALISSEEYRVAYPRLRLAVTQRTEPRSQPWRVRA